MGARFDAGTMMKRGLQTEEGFLQGTVQPTDKEDYSEGSEVSLTQLVARHDHYVGKEVDLVCHTFADKRLPKNIAMCYRFTITCCAADTAPIFIFFEHSDSLVIKSDKWVRADGLMSMIEKQDVAIPSIAVTSLTYVEEPAIPWAM